MLLNHFTSFTNIHNHIKGYTVTDTIGSGAYSTVYRALHDKTRAFVAIKVISKSSHDTKQMKLFEREVAILQSIDHPFIATCFESFEDDDFIYIVTELAEKGSLLNFINTQGHIAEKKARKLFIQLMKALDYLHNEMGIAHRDIKTENIMLDAYFNLKLIDFGFAEEFKQHQMKTFFQNNCGSPKYAAPEVIMKNGIDEKSDIWSAGIILYIMLFGKFPFFCDNINDLYQQILFSAPVFPEYTTPDLYDLMIHILDKNPRTRWSIKEILSSQWVQKGGEQKLYDEIIACPKYFVNQNSLLDSSLFSSFTCLLNIENEEDFNIGYKIVKKMKINKELDRQVHPVSITKNLSKLPSSLNTIPAIRSMNNMRIQIKPPMTAVRRKSQQIALNPIGEIVLEDYRNSCLSME